MWGMTEPLVATIERGPVERARAPEPRATGGGMLQALVVVCGFWWFATGITIAMQRSEETRLAGALIATALGAAGLWLLVAARDEETPRGALRSFLGGALLWGWVSALFYGGWVMGPHLGDGGTQLSMWEMARRAEGATLYSDLLALALIVVAVRLTRGAPNRVGLWTLVLFWGAHQTAKLNVFFGVRNAGAEMLPTRLAFLRSFFGPAHNSPLLPVTLLALAMLAVWLFWRARASDSAFRRQANLLLAILVALALLEHVVLGINGSLPLWEMFVRMREGCSGGQLPMPPPPDRGSPRPRAAAGICFSYSTAAAVRLLTPSFWKRFWV